MQTNPWRDKAQELDRYRWLLLRRRHGITGSVIRFTRDFLRDWCFGFLARWHLAQVIISEPCDFFLLQSSSKAMSFHRKRLLTDALRIQGHTLVESALEKPGFILRKRMLKAPPFSVPCRYFGIAAHAEWLIERHKPRVLLNDRNGSLYSPFLRLSLNLRGSIFVHLAHATTLERSLRLSMNDYDYYFLLGKSSLEALQSRDLRFGSSMAVLSGSHMINSSYDIPVADCAARTLLILGVGPDRESRPDFQSSYELLRDWAVLHPEYRVIVKAHPRSTAAFWRQAALALGNVEVLSGESSLASALSQSTVVVNIASNAAIEAAVARRPIIYVYTGRDIDIFSQEHFFGARVSSVEEFSSRIMAVENLYAESILRSAAFADYHLLYGCMGLAKCVSLLQLLLAGENISGQPLMHSMPNKPLRVDSLYCTAAIEQCLERAYVINLDRRKDRWALMLASLSRVGLVAERFAAVDAAKLIENEDIPSAELRKFLQKVDGVRVDEEIKLLATWACMRSHLAVIQMAKDNGLPAVLIVEDDCEFERYARPVLSRVVRQLYSQPWQMLYLGGTLKKGGRRDNVSENLLRVSKVRLAHAYVVRSELYDRILNEAPSSGLPLDWYYSECLLPTIDAYMVKPALAYQRLYDLSDIENVERLPKFKSRQIVKRWWSLFRYGNK